MVHYFLPLEAFSSWDLLIPLSSCSFSVSFPGTSFPSSPLSVRTLQGSALSPPCITINTHAVGSLIPFHGLKTFLASCTILRISYIFLQTTLKSQWVRTTKISLSLSISILSQQRRLSLRDPGCHTCAQSPSQGKGHGD